MNLRKLTFATGVLASVILAGCSTTSLNTPATIVDRSSYAHNVDRAPVVMPGAGTAGRVTDSGRRHTVVTGDTLYNIAMRYGCDLKDVAALNGVTDPTQLSLGQVLRLPPTIKPGRVLVNSNVRVNRVNTAELDRVSRENVNAVTRPVVDKVDTAAEHAAKTVKKAQEKISTVKPEPIVPGSRMIWPIRGKVVSDFKTNGKGIDIAGTKGDVVVAAMDGQVLFIGDFKDYGNLIILKHSPTLVTAYGHNARMTVKLNQRVKAGQKIAEVGTNDAGKALLRFEVREKGRPVDPMHFLSHR